MSGLSHRFFQSLLVICHGVSVQAETAKSVVVFPSHLPVINPQDISQIWIIEKEIERQKFGRERKCDNAGNKILIKCKWN